MEEVTDGAPSGSGICVSGGGLRAASFAMGALQTLQADRGLLYGVGSADHLAVVSGGSYIGAAALLNAPITGAPLAPLAPGAAENDDMVHHARYLIEDGLIGAWRFVWRLGITALASALLLTWAGFMLTDVSAALSFYWPSLIVTGWLSWPIAIATFLAVGALGVSSESDRTSYQWVLALVGLAGLVATSPTLPFRVMNTEYLRRPRWWLDRPALVLTILVVFILASALPLLIRPLRTVANGIVRNAIRALLILVTCWTVAAFAPRFMHIFDPKYTGTLNDGLPCGARSWECDPTDRRRPAEDSQNTATSGLGSPHSSVNC